MVHIPISHKRCNLSIFLLIPLALSAFTHLWNPTGFPTFHVDEGHYMRRAMEVLQGLGPQESTSTYYFAYDHPYFGQLFLAAILSIINYPDSLNPSNNIQSIEMLFIVPRVLMGILAIVDTFLVYKITETRYNRKVAFISATLFSVMPSTWFLRGILLDSIELPFILLSILFAVYYAKKSEGNYIQNGNNKNIILLLLSGIFLGLAIFTKMPVFTMIPLIVFIIAKRNNNINNKGNNPKTGYQLKALGILFVPVILIPMIWPVYVISMGQFDQWLDGVLYQTERIGKDLRSSIYLMAQMDPVLLMLGAVGLIYAVIKKDYFILLWTFPYLILMYSIDWVVYFHWIILLPVLSIAISIIIEDLARAINYQKYGYLLRYVLMSPVVVFGFLSIIMLISSNLNNSYIELYVLVNRELESHNSDPNTQESNQGITMIGSHRTRALIWIPAYVFNDNVTFRDADLPHDNFTEPIQTKKFLIVADSSFFSRLTGTNENVKDARITKLYYNSSEIIASFIDKESNKYDFMNIRENLGLGSFIEVRANY